MPSRRTVAMICVVASLFVGSVYATGPYSCNTIERFDNPRLATFIRRRMALPQVEIETISRVRDRLTEVIRAADRAEAEGEIQSEKDFRSFISRELVRSKAEHLARVRLGAEMLNGTTSAKERDARYRILLEQAFEELPTEAILVLDTPLTDSGGRSLNRSKSTVVVDHHGPYGAKNPLDNTGTQVLERYRELLKKNEGAYLQSIKNLHESLTGGAERVTYTADNLGDAAEVIAILRSPVILQRLAQNPELLDILIESGRYTDFFVFRGNRYEIENKSDQSQRAILLSKAIMQSHGELLREAGIKFGDRIEANPDSTAQRELLEKAADRAEELILEATHPSFSVASSGRVGALAVEFDRWRGGPSVLKSGRVTSYEQAVHNHQKFLGDLTTDLNITLPKERRVPAAEAIRQLTFGHRPVSTGNQFADWSSSSIANEAQIGGLRPIKFELGGAEPSERGKPVILSKAGNDSVDLTPIADALNRAARKRFQTMLEKAPNPKPEEIRKLVENHTEFTSRGPELVFSFGGHCLSRAEITAIVGETLAAERDRIVPPP